VVQSGEYQRLGSSATRRADVRIISASNVSLQDAVASGRFREDLYYRLNVLELVVPPLAVRPEDVLPLAAHFLGRAAREGGRKAPELSPEAAEALVNHRWPGNVRELQNRMQRALLTATGGVIGLSDLDLGASSRPAAPSVPAPGPLDAERRRLEQALVDADGVVARAAEQLGVSRQALYRKMDRLGIVLERRPRE
jgi:DNA-binding NtrC family response regulator